MQLLTLLHQKLTPPTPQLPLPHYHYQFTHYTYTSSHTPPFPRLLSFPTTGSVSLGSRHTIKEYQCGTRATMATYSQLLSRLLAQWCKCLLWDKRMYFVLLNCTLRCIQKIDRQGESNTLMKNYFTLNVLRHTVLICIRTLIISFGILRLYVQICELISENK